MRALFWFPRQVKEALRRPCVQRIPAVFGTGAPTSTASRMEAAECSRSRGTGGAAAEPAKPLFHLLRTDGLPARANAYSITLQDLFKSECGSPIHWVIVCNYMVDIPWLLSEVPLLRSVPRVVLMHGERGDAAALNLKAEAPSNWEVHAPPLPVAFGTHHSKAFVIGRQSSVTVAIHTANLIRIDWHNKTQAVWRQTFPVKHPRSLAGAAAERRQGGPSASAQAQSGDDRGHQGGGGGARAGGGAEAPSAAAGASAACPGSTSFEECLVQYFSSLGWRGCSVPASLPGQEHKGTSASSDSRGNTIWLNAGFLRKYDYSGATATLVASVPGYHSGVAGTRWGHMAVREALRGHHCFDARFVDPSPPLLLQFSSLGSISHAWLTGEFAESLSAGSAGTQALTPSTGERSAPGKRGRADRGTAAGAALELIWPTVQEVRDSIEGYAAGGSLCGPNKNVSKDFLQPLWRRWGCEASGRARAMPHIKSYTRYARPRPRSVGVAGAKREGGAEEQSVQQRRGTDVAWVLLTSANLSTAAWGSLQKQGSMLFIRSYELGVLFTPCQALEAAGTRTNQPLLTVEAHPRPPLPHVVFSVPGEWAAHRQPTGGAVPGRPGLSYQGVGEGGHGSTPEEGITRCVGPLPYDIPPQPYTSTDTAWAWDLQYSAPDIFGTFWPRELDKHKA